MHYNETVSIIVPVYNKVEKLKGCIDSILSQSYKNIEVLLIDDGSSDGSSEICDNYAEKDNRIVVKHIVNSGASEARNIGINLSHGSFLQFVDADDYIAPNMTEVLFNNIKIYNSDMSVCGYNQIVGDKVVGYINPEIDGKLDKCGYFDLIYLYHLDPLCGSPCNRMIKSSIVKNNNIRFISKLSFAEDFSFVIDCVDKMNSISYTKKCLYYYNLDVTGSLSKVTKKKIEDSWKQQLFFIKRFNNIVAQNNIDKQFPKLISTIYFGLITNSLNSRIKNKNSIGDLSVWVNRCITNFSWFDINKVDLTTNRKNDDYNGKKRKIIINQQRFFLCCIKFHIIPVYIFINKLVVNFVR